MARAGLPALMGVANAYARKMKKRRPGSTTLMEQPPDVPDAIGKPGRPMPGSQNMGRSPDFMEGRKNKPIPMMKPVKKVKLKLHRAGY